MSLQRIKRHKKLLNQLSKAKSIKARRSILAQAPKGLITSISEIIHNLLRGNVTLKNRRHYSILKKNRVILRRLACKKYPVEKKRQVLIQKGGFVAPLLAGIPIIANLLGSLFKR